MESSRICMAKLQCRSGALATNYICHIKVWRNCCRLIQFFLRWYFLLSPLRFNFKTEGTWRFAPQKFEWCTQLCVLGTYIKHWHLRGAAGIRDINSCLELDVQHLRMNIEVYCIYVVCYIETRLMAVISHLVMLCALYVYIVYSEISNNGVASFNRLAASSIHRTQRWAQTQDRFSPFGSDDFRD